MQINNATKNSWKSQFLTIYTQPLNPHHPIQKSHLH